MSDTRFTPGPWAVDPLGLGTIGDVSTLDGTAIAQAQQITGRARGFDDITRAANARLIAASPDLYSALEGLLERYTGLVNCGDCGHWNPETDAQVIEARAALKKARGE